MYQVEGIFQAKANEVEPRYDLLKSFSQINTRMSALTMAKINSSCEDAQMRQQIFFHVIYLSVVFKFKNLLQSACQWLTQIGLRCKLGK